MAALYQQLIALVLVVLVAMAVVEGGAISKRRAPSIFETEQFGDRVEKPLTENEVEFFNKMVMRIMDSLIEDARERGVTSSALENMMRKRGGIRKCFFHAVNCW